MNPQTPYIPKNKVKIVTAAALFDGHDAAINIMRRIIQSTGVEVIHLGHDRSVDEVVNTYSRRCKCDCFDILSGGHMEYFKYMYDLLVEKGTLRYLVEVELFCLMKLKNCKLMELLVFTPDDGRSMGLQGMINDLVERSDYPVGDKLK
jgi:methylmalonyl-CoA mutase